MVNTLLPLRYATPLPAPPLCVTVLEVVRVVNAPVVAVVAPIVPLMLMEAVPVRLVTVPLLGVPSAGVTRVGEVFSTTEPVPVDVVTPVPPLATGKVPVTPVVNGKPVALVSVTDCGVPKIGVTNVGEVPRLVKDEPVTPDASVAPVKVPAGATTTAVVMLVVKPFAFIVTTGMAVLEPVTPAVATVASVPAAVTFPVPLKLGDV